MFDSSLRTPVVYAIAVRYQTPMWRAGAMLRAGCMAGFWLLLFWFPPGTWPQGAALLALGTIGAVTAWAHNRSSVLDFLVARDAPGLSAAARHLIGAKQRATADLSGCWRWSGSGRRPTCTTGAIPSSATRRSTGACCGRGRAPGQRNRRRCSRRRRTAEGSAKFCIGWRPYGWHCGWHCAGMPLRRSGSLRGRAGSPGWAGRPGTVTRGTRGSHPLVIKCSSRL